MPPAVPAGPPPIIIKKKLACVRKGFLRDRVEARRAAGHGLEQRGKQLLGGRKAAHCCGVPRFKQQKQHHAAH